MDKNRNFFKQINTLRDAAPISKVWDKMKEIAISFIVAALFLGVIGRIGDSSLLPNDLAWVLWLLAVTFVGRLILGFIRIPAEMDKERREEIDRQKQLITELDESKRPKLELRYDNSDSESVGKFGSVRTFRIKVKNAGQQPLRDVAVVVEKTQPPLPSVRSIRLRNFHDEDKIWNGGMEKLVNVIEADTDGNKCHLYADREQSRGDMELRDYEIVIMASADGTSPTVKRFKFSYDASNTEQPFAFKELPDDEQ